MLFPPRWSVGIRSILGSKQDFIVLLIALTVYIGIVGYQVEAVVIDYVIGISSRFGNNRPLPWLPR